MTKKKQEIVPIKLDDWVEHNRASVKKAIEDFNTDNEPQMAVILISANKGCVGGNFTANAINLARAIKQIPRFDMVVKIAQEIADGNYRFLEMSVSKGTNVNKIIDRIYKPYD